jgi:hypothetical protein
MADLGRISGPMLKDNLLRGGVDLVFENRLGDNNLFLDVNTTKIGINTDAITRELTINDSAQTDYLIVDTFFTSKNIKVNSTTIESLLDELTFNPASGITNLSSIATYGIKFDNNVIQSLNSNETIELRPNGAGFVNFRTDELDIDGNLHTTGNITLDGTITIGNSDTDSVSFASDIDSDIIPDLNETFNLGSSSKKWLAVHTEFVNGQLLETSGISVSGVNSISLRQGNIWYVAVNGSNTNVGDHQNGPFLTVKHALENANGGDTVYIYPGEYQEEFPLTVPDGVTVRGAGIRSVNIKPTTPTRTKDAFLLHGDTTVSDLTVSDFYYDSSLNTGYGFRFAPNYTIPSRSPYIQNISVITQEVAGNTSPTPITIGPASTGVSLTSNSVTLSKASYSQILVDSLVGQTAVIDRYPNPPLIYTVVSIDTEPLSPTEWRMTVDTTFNPAGQLKPISFYPDVGAIEIVTNDIWDTTGNSVGEKWVAWFKTNLPINFETTVQSGWTINVAGTLYIVDYVIQDPVNTNMWRIYVTTSLVGGVGIPIFSSPIADPALFAGRGALADGAYANTATTDLTSISTDNIFVTVNGEQIVTSYGEASMLFHSVTFIVPDAIGLYATNGVRIEWLNSFTYFASKGLYAVNGVEGRISIDGSTIKYGAEIRSIGSANVYGQVGAEADGNQTLMYLINHNFAYIGVGTTAINDSTEVIQANEVVQLNSGKIYYQSHNKGMWRVGDAFFVNLERGEISIDGVSTTFGGITALNFVDEDSEILINASTVDANNIRIAGNNIQSIIGDINIASASTNINLTQNVNVTKNIDISNDFIIKGTLTLGNQQNVDVLTVSSRLDEDLIPVNSDTYSVGSVDSRWNVSNIENINLPDIEIIDNTISTRNSNSDLELVAHLTGNIYTATSDVEIDQNLTIDGSANLKNTFIQGVLQHTGNKTQTGSITQTGNYNLTGNLTVSNDVTFEDIKFIDNRITTLNSNSNLDLRAQGTGILTVPLDPVNLNQQLTVVGNTTTSNIINSSTVTSDKFFVDELLVRDNFIASINSNSNIELYADGSGGVFFETLKFTDTTISTTSGNTNISIKPGVSNNLIINDNKALQVPVGTGAQRLVGTTGDVRYDSTDGFYSGWSSSRVTFGGIFSASRTTKVTPTPTTNILNFITNGVNSLDISINGLRTNGLGSNNDLLVDSNVISTLTANSNINLTPNGTGQTTFDDIHIYQNEFINQSNTTPMTLAISGSGHVKFNSTTGLQIPIGGNDDRPADPELGDIRWNTDANITEVFNGFEYVGVAGTLTAATEAQIQEFNEIYAILLG